MPGLKFLETKIQEETRPNYIKRAKPRPKEDLSEVLDIVQDILKSVQDEGETAVRRYSQKFDSWAPDSFKISPDDIKTARSKLPTTMAADIDYCQAQIRNFAEAQMKRLVEFEEETLPGVFLGQKVIPVASSGSYVPGGRYPIAVRLS